MPVCVLPSLNGMQIQNGIQVMLGTPLNHPVEPLEACFQVPERLIIPLEMPVVERQPDHGRPARFDEGDILLGEEIVEPAVEEVACPIRPQDFCHSAAQTMLISGVAIDEVLHIHPSANANTAQADWLPLLIYHLVLFDLQHQTAPQLVHPPRGSRERRFRAIYSLLLQYQ